MTDTLVVGGGGPGSDDGPGGLRMMDELQRRALARLPLSEGDVRLAYGGAYSPWASVVVQKLCESHERLRAELGGTTTLLRDAEAERDRLQRLVESLAARVAAQAELLGS